MRSSGRSGAGGGGGGGGKEEQSEAVQLHKYKTRVAELEDQFAHVRQECNARVIVLEETLNREQSRNREREEKETAKRQELISKVNSLTEERATLRAQLTAQHDVEDEMNRIQAELKEARKEVIELKTKALDDKRNAEEQLREKQRVNEKQAQDISDLQCKLAIVEHKLQLSVARLSQNDTQSEHLTDLEEQVVRLSEKLKAAERDRRTEKDAFDDEKKQMRERQRALEQELAQEREGVSKAEIIADYESKIDGAHKMLRSAFASSSAAGLLAQQQQQQQNPEIFGTTTASSGALLNNNNNNNNNNHTLSPEGSSGMGATGAAAASFRLSKSRGNLASGSSFSFRGGSQQQQGNNNNQPPLLQSSLSNNGPSSSLNNNNNNVNATSAAAAASGGGGGGTGRSESASTGMQDRSISAVHAGASLSALSEALHYLDDPARAENLLRRFIDSAVAARSSVSATFTASSGLPDATITDRTALLVQLANVTNERDMLRMRLKENEDTHDTTTESRSIRAVGMLPTSRSPPKFNRSPAH